VLLTHDIDSRADIERIPALRKLERSFGLTASVGFVPNASWPDRKVVEDLVAEGCEVYCHDIAHDGKLPYISDEARRAAFDRFFSKNDWARPLLRGFRSGQLLMSAPLLGLIEELFDYDLSFPDTEHGGPYGPTAGCATVLPYAIGRLLEVPLTIPQDFYLEHVERLDGDAMAAAWKAKLAYVVERGGVAVVNTHPVWINPKRPAAWNAYTALLREVAAADVWVTTGAALRDWLWERRDGMTEA
jgi:hypothetical protein